MSLKDKIFETGKIVIPAVFQIFVIWEIMTGNITADLVLQLWSLIFAIIGGAMQGSAISRIRLLRNFEKQSKKYYGY